MQAHVANVLKGVVKESSTVALSELLGSRKAATELAKKLTNGQWTARLGIVLIDDARLRAYTPRAACEWLLRYETNEGLECTRGGTWFSQADGSYMVEAESYVSRTSLIAPPAAAEGRAAPTAQSAEYTIESYATASNAEELEDGPWTRAPPDQRARATASETRAILRAKNAGWTTDDIASTGTKLRANTLAADAVSASPFKVEVGPDAILASLEAYHDKYCPAEIAIQDVVVGTGDDVGLFAARRTVAVAKLGSDNMDSDRELVFGEIASCGGVPKLRYARSIFDPTSSPRRPDVLPAEYPQSSIFTNYEL